MGPDRLPAGHSQNHQRSAARLARQHVTKIAIHFDVDTIDADEIQLGLGADRGGLTSAQARRVINDLNGAADVVALTVAEFIQRQVMHLQQLLAGFPLIT
jgi:arginase